MMDINHSLQAGQARLLTAIQAYWQRLDAGDGLVSGLGGGRQVIVEAGDEFGDFRFCAAAGAWPFI